LGFDSKPVKTETIQASVKKSEISPEKLIFRLDEVSRLIKVPAKTIESWEKEFPFLHAGQNSRGQKIFRNKDVEIMLRIKALLLEKKLTIAGVKRRIEEEFGMRSATPVHPERIKKVLLQVRDDLQEIASRLQKPAK
jgi:DNA-binding transcriptional MerR regulator